MTVFPLIVCVKGLCHSQSTNYNNEWLETKSLYFLTINNLFYVNNEHLFVFCLCIHQIYKKKTKNLDQRNNEEKK